MQQKTLADRINNHYKKTCAKIVGDNIAVNLEMDFAKEPPAEYYPETQAGPYIDMWLKRIAEKNCCTIEWYSPAKILICQE